MNPSSYTQPMERGKYRTRTWLRGRLPWALVSLVPKGGDCGAHEWYRQDATTDACYHCQMHRQHEPLPVRDEALAELERAARAGSQPAMDVIEGLIAEGTVHLVRDEPVAH